MAISKQAKALKTKLQTVKASSKASKKPVEEYSKISQFFGPKTTAHSAAEGRLKVSASGAGSKAKTLKSILSKVKSLKKKKEKKPVPFMKMPGA